MNAPQIVWLRRDLRLADHPAFVAAAEAGPVIPVYVLDDETPGEFRLGGAARWWLHRSLASLGSALEAAGSRLVLRRGRAAEVLAAMMGETGAGAIHAIRHYEPWWRESEDALGDRLVAHQGNYLLPPGTVTTGAGTPFRIYTPFAKAARQRLPWRQPLDAPSLAVPEDWPRGDSLESLALLPTKPDWAGGLRDTWEPGEAAARERLDAFLDVVDDYHDDRNLPAVEGTSGLSPHLHWGEISPTQAWNALERHASPGADSFRGELLWRDYAQNVIFQFPDYARRNHRDRFDGFAWRNPGRGHPIEGELRAWQQGRTGYPIVDAGMRQLWATGWMHNRVRMIAASFLIKHLLIDWRHGESWFRDTLVDADYASNAVNWQWVAGTGVDANMFTRIMAPLLQSEKFAAGDYIRHWVPELAGLDDDSIHDPDDARRPATYPEKIIGHKEARERALQAYREMPR